MTNIKDSSSASPATISASNLSSSKRTALVAFAAIVAGLGITMLLAAGGCIPFDATAFLRKGVPHTVSLIVGGAMMGIGVWGVLSVPAKTSS